MNKTCVYCNKKSKYMVCEVCYPKWFGEPGHIERLDEPPKPKLTLIRGGLSDVKEG